jgi:hypothetical protein
MSLAPTDRMPRQDVDGSPIYDRMNSLITNDKKSRNKEAHMRLAYLLVAGIATVTLAACNRQLENIPPNYIAMRLTPTGYEDHIYTPGQVDIGETSYGGQGNQLVLIQRSGIEIKEAFLDAAANSDHTDHRCLTPDQNPVAIDVRLVLALPDYQTPAGQKDLKTLFLLGIRPRSETALASPSFRLSASTSSRRSCRSAATFGRSAPASRTSTKPSKPSRLRVQANLSEQIASGGQGSRRPRCAASSTSESRT